MCKKDWVLTAITLILVLQHVERYSLNPSLGDENGLVLDLDMLQSDGSGQTLTSSQDGAFFLP